MILETSHISSIGSSGKSAEYKRSSVFGGSSSMAFAPNSARSSIYASNSCLLYTSIANEAKAHAFRKAFVCSDPDLIKFGVTAKVTDILDREGLAYEIYSDIKANPTIENVKNGVVAFKASGADYIIAIGGGSSMDTSKAIGIIIANPEFEDVRSLEGVAPTKKPCVPIIAVPTTAGTAAEVTINYVITDVERKRKFVCVDPHDMPIIAVVDPDMMSSMPKGLTASTGMDALTHAIEGLSLIHI